MINIKSKYIIYVDDERPIPKNWRGKYGYEEKIIICRSYQEAVNALQIYPKLGMTFISLDHDLGEKKTGYDIAKYIIKHEVPLIAFFCHSMNPVGKANIVQLLTRYGYTYMGY